MKKHIIFLVLTNGIVSMGLAQNYDADSVYYTPIPKPTQGRSSDDEQKNPGSVVYFFAIQAGPLVGCNDCS